MEAGGDPALGLQLGGQMADDVVVLGVDHHQRAGLAGDGHDLEDFPVGQRQALIGHEHLERGIPVADRRRQLLPQHVRRGVGDDEVEAVIGVAPALGLGVVVPDGRAQALPALLEAERDHRRVAAEHRRAGAAFEVIRLHHIRAGWLREMHVAVDAAGQHKPVRGVDHVLRRTEVEAEGGDAAVL